MKKDKKDYKYFYYLTDILFSYDCNLSAILKNNKTKYQNSKKKK